MSRSMTSMASYASLLLLFVVSSSSRAEVTEEIALREPATAGQSFASDEERARYLRRLERASEVLFNSGFLYSADGMNQMRTGKNREATGATLQRGVSFLQLSRQYNQEAKAMAQLHKLAYEAPQTDGGILQGEKGARDVLSKLESNFHLRWGAFNETMLATVLDPEKDIVLTIAEAMKPVEGVQAESKLRELLELAAGLSQEEKNQHLESGPLAGIAAEFSLDADVISVSAQSAASVWDTTREGASGSRTGTTTSGPSVATRSAHPGNSTRSSVGLPGNSRIPETKHANGRDDLFSIRPPTKPTPKPPAMPTPPATKIPDYVLKAAEAAALAGARVKDKQIAFAAMLNWEMRRALKEFLFAYTVASHIPSFPCAPLDSSGRALASCPVKNAGDRYDFAVVDPREQTNETSGPFLPTICQITDPTNNYCMKAGIPGIPEFQGGGSWGPGIPEFQGGGGWGVADPVVAAVSGATDQSQNKLSSCQSRTEFNQEILTKLLYGFEASEKSSDSTDPYKGRSGLDHLGVLTRMALLRARIDMIDSWLSLNVGAAGFRNITDKDLKVLMAKGTAYDRPLSAYQAARASLNASGYPNAHIELTEVPGKERATRFLDEYVRVNVATMKFETKGQLDRGDCFSFRESRVIPHFPLGIKAGPDLFEKYSVKVTVKIGDKTSEAYAAATPNPVRIGPVFSNHADPDVARGKLVKDEIMNTLTTARFPNPLIQEGETDSEKEGFSRNAHLGYLREAAITLDRMDLGARLAGALAPWELSRFSLPCSFEGATYSVGVPLLGADSVSAFRRRFNAYLTTDDSPVIKKIVTDGKVSKLLGRLKQLKQIEQHSIPDPLLRDNEKLLQFTRTKGKPFSVSGNPEGAALLERSSRASGVCSPGAELVK